MINIALYKNEIFLGGSEKQLISLVDNLDKNEFQSFIVAGKVNNYMMDSNVNIYLFHTIGYFRQIIELNKYLRDNKINICHCWDFRSSVIGLFASLFLPVTLIDGSIRSAPSKRIFQSNRKYLLDKIKIKLFHLFRITIISNSLAGLRAYGIKPGRKSIVIPNCIHHSNSFFTKEPTSYFNICMIANFRFKKDFTTLIEAGQLVIQKYKNVKFYLIGDGQDKAKYLKLVKDLNLEPYFVFTGMIENVNEYLSNMDICVLTNEVTGEGMSNSIMEYMINGKPVIATDMGGNNELVIDGLTGFLIEEKNTSMLAKKIQFFIENPVKITEFGKNSFNRIISSFSIEQMIKGYTSIYYNILSIKHM